MAEGLGSAGPPRDVYTHGHHESVLRSHRWRTAENSAGFLLPHLAPGLDLLDLGCGPGTITLGLAGAVAPGRVLGVDREPQVLESARAAAAAAGDEATRFTVGDIYALDLADDSFDVVHAHQVLQHLTDPVAALRAMRRICRPGGLVAARDADYAAMAWHPASTEMDDWLALYRRVAHGNGAEPDAGRRLVSWAHAAGFDEVTASADVWCYASADDRRWWGELWADRVTHSALAEQALTQGLASPQQLQALADAWRRWAGERDGWFAVLHGEILCRG